MKKILLICVLFAFTAAIYAQEGKSKSIEPSKIMSVQESNLVNGTAQPVMKNGKPYAQWVAEEKAKRKADPGTVVSAQEQLIAMNAADAKPAPEKVQPAQPQRDNDGYTRPAPVQSAVVDASTQQAAQQLAARPATDALLSHFGTGQIILQEQPAAADPGSFTAMQAASANKPASPAAKPAAPRRSAEEIEKARQNQQQGSAKNKTAPGKETAAAASTAPELKVEIVTDNPPVSAPAAKPPVTPPAGKQE